MGPVESQLALSIKPTLLITWDGGRNCTKLVLKPFATKNGLF